MHIISAFMMSAFSKYNIIKEKQIQRYINICNRRYKYRHEFSTLFHPYIYNLPNNRQKFFKVWRICYYTLTPPPTPSPLVRLTNTDTDIPHAYDTRDIFSKVLST